MELTAAAMPTESDTSYLEAAIQAAVSEISARAWQGGRLAAKTAARLFRPGVDDGVVW